MQNKFSLPSVSSASSALSVFSFLAAPLRWLSRFRNFFLELNTSQKLYLIALFYLVMSALTAEKDEIDTISVGIIAMGGLALEIWPKMVNIWETLLGRICLILFYAVLGNLAVASASQKLNQIVGADPSSLLYAKGFVTLLMAPIWFIVITVLVMIMYMIFLQLWLILRSILKIIGLSKAFNKSTILYPKRTALMRLCLIPIMLFTLVGALNTYGNEFANIQLFNSGEVIESNAVKKNLSPEEIGELEELKSEVIKTKTKAKTNNITIGANDKSPAVTIDSDSITNMDEIIAQFVYWVEAFEFSQCEKTKEERMLYIGDTEILVAQKDKSAKNGIRFSVRECVLKSKQ